MSQTNKKKIFISYQREDQSLVQNLVQVLQNTGNYEVWFDKRLQGGQNWWDEIIKNIQLADIVILALSRTYLKSEPCRVEREYAQALGKAIFPLKMDKKLPYEALPEDVSSLQIFEYYGQAHEFQSMVKDLAVLNSPPLPNPLPPPPPADFKKEGNKTVLIGIGLLSIVIIAIGAWLFNPANDGTEIPSATDDSDRASDTVTEQATVQGEIGDYDINIQYGGQDSLTLLANDNSNLWGISLSSNISEPLLLTERFPDLALLDYTISAGTCLRFEREGTNPVLPLACNTSQVQRIQLTPAEIFWFDSSTNQYVNVILRQGDNSPTFCPHDNGSGNCNLTFEE